MWDNSELEPEKVSNLKILTPSQHKIGQPDKFTDCPETYEWYLESVMVFEELLCPIFNLYVLQQRNIIYFMIFHHDLDFDTRKSGYFTKEMQKEPILLIYLDTVVIKLH